MKLCFTMITFETKSKIQWSWNLFKISVNRIKRVSAIKFDVRGQYTYNCLVDLLQWALSYADKG